MTYMDDTKKLQTREEVLDYLKCLSTTLGCSKNIDKLEEIKSDFFSRLAQKERNEYKLDEVKYYSILNSFSNLTEFATPLSDEDTHIYNDYESIKKIVDLMCERYENIIENTSSIKEMAKKAFALTGRKLSTYEIDDIEKHNIFTCYMEIGQVLSNYDLENMNSNLSKDNSKNKTISNKLKKYIKYSKTGNLVYIDSFRLVFSNVNVNINIDDIKGIFNYDLLFKALKESDLDISFLNTNCFEQTNDISYDDFLDAIINQRSILIYVSDKRFKKTYNNYVFYTPTTDVKQKVFKRG